MKILQIDDSTQICEMYEDYFTSDSNTIKSVNDGKEGLKLAVKNDYDLILLDIRMPQYTGMDFLYDLKEQKPSELKKIIVTSMLEFNETQIKELMNFGIHSVEKKPLSLQQFETFKKTVSKNKEKLGPLSMLIIDDQPATTTMLSEFFNFNGFKITVTNDPWDGLKYIQQEHFDVILLDIAMPKLSGIQIIGILATDAILKDQNIFIYSEAIHCNNQANELCRRDGVNGFLKKPMPLDKMLARITQDLNLQKTITSQTN